MSKKFAFISLILLFFMWGFITCMNDILIPYLKEVFHLNHFQSMFVQFAFFGAYFIGSLMYFIISSIWGDPINKVGYQRGIVLGLLISGFGASLFYPAAIFESFSFFLTALFTMGIGFTLLQIAANPYVAILGQPETASGRLNLAQGFNSLGTTIAPIIGGYLIFKVFAVSEISKAGSVVVPYLFFSLIFVLLAIYFSLIKLPVFTNKDKVFKGFPSLKFLNLRYGILAIFFYVGAEVSIGSILISFLKSENIAGLTEIEASHYVAIYWGGLMIGRFMGAVSLSSMQKTAKRVLLLTIPLIAIFLFALINGLTEALYYSIFIVLLLIAFFSGKFKTNRTLFIFSVAVILLLATAITFNGNIAMWCVLGVGLFNSIMWSNIFTMAIKGLGKYTSQGSSLLVMAIVGGALIPLLQGYFADIAGVQISFIIPLLAYLYIAFYSMWGYKTIKLKNNG